MPSPESQTFNDGVCALYAVENTAEPGNKPVERLVLKGTLRYAELTVGMNRFAKFLQNDVEVARVLRVQRKIEVSTQDVVIPIDGQTYKVVQVQYKQDVVPRCMDLSLERIENIW